MELTTDNIFEISRELDKICLALDRLEQSGEKLIIGIDDIIKMTGWSRNTTRNFMNRPDFPLIHIGKELQVNKIAFILYTMQRLV